METWRRQLFPNRYPAFDGTKNLYTSKPLTNNFNDVLQNEITISDEDGRPKNYKVTVKFANDVDMTPLRDFLSRSVTPTEALQVVDIVLRMAPLQSCIPAGRSFFMRPREMLDLGEGMQMYNGFYQSAIRGWAPLLNIDVAHKAFPKAINIVDCLADLLSTGRQQVRPQDLTSLGEYEKEKLSKFLKTLRIIYEIPGQPASKKSYRVNGLGVAASQSSFIHEGKNITVVEYFARIKNFRLRYPNLPTVWVGNLQRKDKILLPLELCTIVADQAIPRKMTENQTAKMIRYSATSTDIRKNKIMNGLQTANYNQNSTVSQEFGFSVGNQFQKLDARVLDPPSLKYSRRSVPVSRGVWRGDSFLAAATIEKWTIVSVCRYRPRPDDFKTLEQNIISAGRDAGMSFGRPTEPFRDCGNGNYRDIEQLFKNLKNEKYNVIFVIIPDSGPQYSYVKKAAELVVGCLTQCVKSGTVGRRMNKQTAANILLKVNSKLNGINHTFADNVKPAILSRPFMIMGADVTHPGPDSRDIPSVAAITASHDPKAFQYNICWRLQDPKVEIIEDLENVAIEHLRFFREKTGRFPEKILFFRDGVSEGQFNQVRNEEIKALRSACKREQKSGENAVQITFLVVQKRHHTRLFPLDKRDSEDKNFNVPAGTCVDTNITHPYLQDFYLVSHASIQGVAKPTKYVTLWDDLKLDNDTVEQLTFYLCHMFTRCNRSVSYPAPTYYAHLAAARAKVYIENDHLNLARLKDEFQRFQILDEIRKGKPMFFV
nr:AGO2 protein 2097 [Hypothenemus hampei]